jgi:hypothetical protein
MFFLNSATSGREVCLKPVIFLYLLRFFAVAVSSFRHFHFFLGFTPPEFLNSLLSFPFHFLYLLFLDFLHVLIANQLIRFNLEGVVLGQVRSSHGFGLFHS